MCAINPTYNVSQRPKKADELRWPHLPGLESAWEPQLQCPEPKIVMRNPHFCVAAYLLSKRTAHLQSDSNPLKASL
jgi:hypothetical protein